MSGFSCDWLALRESADHRARDPELLSKLSVHFNGREQVSVYDLGTGTGSNLRAIAPFLPAIQHWTLVDHDAALLAAACDTLARWADSSHPTASGIEISRENRSILVTLKRADLASEPAAWGSEKPNLVTAAALFDLVSAEWIERFVNSVTRTRATFYTALTHSSPALWSPVHPLDAAMTGAFEAHFCTDKGFGPSTGSGATALMADAFARAGYKVERRESPWQLGDTDRGLVAAIVDAWAHAVNDTGRVSTADVATWCAARKANATCVIGHEDLLAIPD